MFYCSCGRKIKQVDLDIEESKKHKQYIYACECNNLYTEVGELIGCKELGWRTKKKLRDKEELSNIPF